MNGFTFGIITDGNQPNRIQDICNSIWKDYWNEPLQYDEPQIIVIGGETESFRAALGENGVIQIPFDETQKIGWITKKKNLVAQVAYYDRIVLMHDYVALEQGWFEGFKKFEEENPSWLTCINPIKNLDGTRFRDWCEIYNDSWMCPPIDDQKPPEYPAGRLIPYSQKPNPRWQYYSGAYACYKKKVLLEVPFDETRVWGQGEDVQHSRLLYKHYGPEVFSLNPYSSVKFLKNKERAFWEK